MADITIVLVVCSNGTLRPTPQVYNGYLYKSFKNSEPVHTIGADDMIVASGTL